MHILAHMVVPKLINACLLHSSMRELPLPSDWPLRQPWRAQHLGLRGATKAVQATMLLSMSPNLPPISCTHHLHAPVKGQRTCRWGSRS